MRQALEAGGVPSPADGNDYRIAASVGQAFLARARSSAPTLLIPLDAAPTTVGRRGGGFALNPLPRVAFEHNGKRWEQAAATLECTDSQLVEVFLVLVVDIADRLASSTSQVAWSDILGWVEEWQMLLARRGLLTEQQELGLWGELWVISRANDIDRLVKAWRGPEREAMDFFLEGIALEVKASRRAHVHHVSQSQLDRPAGVHEGYLLSLWVAVEPSRGVSLGELVDEVLTRVSDPPAVLKQIAAVGYVPLDRDQYATRFLPLESPRWFRSDDVPRVRSFDPGVSQLRYVVTLNPAKALSGELEGRLWSHFSQPMLSLRHES